MASPNRQSPLTIDDLIDAQKSMIKRSDVTEQQIRIAQQQLEKLEAIRNAATVANAETIKEDADINRITRKKGDAAHATLGDVQQEIRGLRQDLTANGTAPRAGRSPLPLMTIGGSESGSGESNSARTERLQKIGEAIGRKQGKYGDVNRQTTVGRNTETYEKFIRETSKKDELLASASDDQKKIFSRLEDVIVALRESNEENSVKLRKELAGLSEQLGDTEPGKTKDKMQSIMASIQLSAKTGVTGNKGNLGDALRAATGKSAVLKPGLTRDPRTQRVHQIDPVTGKLGTMVAEKDAVMGRAAGSASIAGNFFKGKVEEFNNQYQSTAIPDFIDRNITPSASTGTPPTTAGSAANASKGSWLSRAAGAGKNLIGKIPVGALKGGVAALGGAALSYGGDKLKEAGHEKAGSAADVAGQAAAWGGTGAMIGSVVPGIGTAIGAGVGAVAGGAYGLYKNWDSLTGKSSPAAAAGAAPAMAAGVPRQNNVAGLSAANADARQIAPAPIVINNGGSQAVAPAPVQNMMLPRGNVRPQESAVEKYSGRQAAFY